MKETKPGGLWETIKTVFYALMFTAFWLNVSVPVTISLWKPYCERAAKAGTS